MSAIVADASVVVTCYNLERYIGAAIESVLAQDFAGEVEVIVADDCSTDGSANVIRACPDVRYLRTPRNGGVLLAMLAGLEATTSDLVFFLDGDDLWEPGKLSAVLPRFAANTRVGFVTHDLHYAGPDGEPLDRPTRPEAAMTRVAPQQFGERVREGILEIDDFVWLGSAFAIRKSVIEHKDFENFARALPDPANTYQDWTLAYWIAAQSEVELDHVPQKLFRYRLHELNYSGDARTPERAIRNLTRTLNTNRAILEIARMRRLPARIIRIVEDRIAFGEYRIDLDSGRRGRAAARFLRTVPELRRRGVLFKELLRFAAVQVVGPGRFARFAAKRTILRDLPVS
jgi:glycosyltransferase involved in cell wall biosynthesis